MTLLEKSGHFAKDSSGVDSATQVVNTSFQPKVLLIWLVYNQTSSGQAGGNYYSSFGWSDGSNHRTIANALADATGGNTNCDRQSDAAHCVYVIDHNRVLLASATVVFNATNFTLTWDENTDTTAAEVHFKIYGGTDITGVEAGTITIPNAAGIQSHILGASVQNITDGNGIGFFMTHGGVAGVEFDNTFAFGAAVSSVSEASYSHRSDSGVGTSNPGIAVSDTTCILVPQVNGAAAYLNAEFNGWDSSGLNLNWLTVQVAGTRPLFYLVIKGGNWGIGNNTVGTTTGNKVISTNFTPKGVLLITVNASSPGVVQQDVSYDISAASDSSTEESSTYTEDAGIVANTVIGRASSITKICRVLEPTADPPTVDVEAELDSLNANDFTLNFTTVDGTAYKFMYIYAGDQGAPPSSASGVVNVGILP